MPWQEQTLMSLRQEFVALAEQEVLSMRALCARSQIAPKTGYKWLKRARAGELTDQSRRPHHYPDQTSSEIERMAVALRDGQPTWGGRKLAARLRTLKVDPVPAPRTITDILRRHGRLGAEPAGPSPYQSFEHVAPNPLWQLDCMGQRPMADDRWVFPLTLIDDHSRFALLPAACPHQQRATVQERLTVAFERYGLPDHLLTDNGPPWGTAGQGGLTGLEAWLLRLGIDLIHGRPYHPQTQGKVERLHRTIAADVFGVAAPFASLAGAQTAFDAFRRVYNQERPHQALDLAVPAKRYQLSPRRFPATLPEPVYAPDDEVRIVRSQGAIGFKNRSWFLSRGVIGEHVAVRPTTIDGVYEVRFCQRLVQTLDLRQLV